MVKMLAIALFFAVAAVGAFVYGSYYIVRTTNGYQLIEKKAFAFSGTMQDTREWSPMDYLKNPDVTKGLAKEKWSKLKETFSEGWSQFSDGFEKQVAKLEADSWPDKAKEELKDLRKAIRKKYDALLEKLEKQDLSKEAFEKKVKELNEWSDRELEKLRKKFA